MTEVTASTGNVKDLTFTYRQICSVLFKLRYLLTVLTTKLSEIRICRYKAWYQLSNIVIYLDMTQVYLGLTQVYQGIAKV